MLAVVLLLLTATALAHGTLLVARAELNASRAYAGALEDKAALRARRDEALAAGLDSDLMRLPIWDVAAVGGQAEGVEPTDPAWQPLRVRRVGPESWWLERAALDGGSRRIGTSGLLLWWLDPVSRIRALGAVVTVGQGALVRIDGSIDRLGFGLAEAPLDAATCDPEVGPAFEGVVPDAVATGADGSAAALGLLSFEDLVAGTSVGIAGTGVPFPSEWAGVCSTDEPWNWGDPERPTGPCGAHIAVRRTADTLHVAGGSGQAMLVVDGDLQLSGDARLYGMVVASGVVTLEDRSELHGMVVADGGLIVGAGATVRGSACWAARALRAGATEWMPSPTPVPRLPPVSP